jgi:carbonic anhydrase/acetyltransferase-like protein (isoleucine patch superfamily)
MHGIADTVFVHPAAVFHGRVVVGEYSSLWASSVIRADFDRVTVGRFTSIQDNVSVHADRGKPTTIGDNVTVAHNAVIHAATIEDNCMISMGAIVQDGALVGKGTIVGAGAVVRERQQIPPNSIVIGVPAQVREAKPGQMRRITDNALSYAALAQLYKRGWDVTSVELHRRMMEELRPFFDPKG